MKSAVALCLMVALVGASSCTPKPAPTGLPLPNKQNVAKIFEGIMWGLLKERGFDDIEHCIVDSLDAATDFKTAVHDFMQKDFDGVKAGFEEMGAGIQEVLKALDDCKDIKADLTKIVKYAQIFKDPKTVAYQIGVDLLLNGKEIYADIDKQIAFFQRKNFFAFGEEAGIVLGLLLPPDSTSLSSVMKTRSERHTYDFLAGYLDVAHPGYSQQELYNNVNGLGEKVFDHVSYHVKANRENIAFPTNFNALVQETNHAVMFAAAELEQSNAFYGQELINMAKGAGCKQVFEEPDFERVEAMLEAYKKSNIREFGQHYAQLTYGACYRI